MPFGFRKKSWEKVMCTFELQAYGGSEGPGWHSIAEATYTLITVAEAAEMFEPDRHYRLIARATEGPQAGRFVGVVWDHYEPFKGLVKKGAKEARVPAAKPKEPEDVLEDWADRVDKVLAPLPRIFETLEKIRVKYAGGGAGEGEEGEVPAWQQLGPPEFDGKLPVMLHPYVIHSIAEEIKGVIEFGAKRMENIFGVGGLPGEQPPKEEEEEAVLPTLESFKKKKAAAEQPPVTEEKEKEEEEEPTIPMLKKEPPIEEKKEEAVPSLEEKPEEAPKEEEEEIKGDIGEALEESSGDVELPLFKKPRRRKKDV
jgi:hypothetical protein